MSRISRPAAVAAAGFGFALAFAACFRSQQNVEERPAPLTAAQSEQMNVVTVPPPRPTSTLQEFNIAPPSITPAPLTPMPSPAASPLAPAANPSGTAAVSPQAQGSQQPTAGESPLAEATEVPPEMDITAMAPTVQISELPIAAEITGKTPPSRALAIRMTDNGRAKLLAGKLDDAIRLFDKALTIDANNPYAYFYLGRTWFRKKNYSQAITFFQRAELGFTSNPAWQAETYGFEGATFEESGDINKAQQAYKKAIDLAPNNRMARAGYGRVAPAEMPTPNAEATVEVLSFPPAGAAPMASPAGGAANPGSAIPPPPAMAPPGPAPAPGR